MLGLASSKGLNNAFISIEQVKDELSLYKEKNESTFEMAVNNIKQIDVLKSNVSGLTKKMKESEKSFNEAKNAITSLSECNNKKLFIKLKKLDEKAVVPSYAHNGDVGMDMTAISVEYDEEHDMYIYHTGLAFESDFNIGQFLFPRSSNSKKESYLTNSVGIADSAIYRGEIQFRYKNRVDIKLLQEIEGQKAYMETFTNGMVSWTGSKQFKVHLSNVVKDALAAKEIKMTEILNDAKKLKFAPYSVGDRVGQMVFLNYPTVNIEVVDELSTTDRGEGGFGSTGK